MGRTVRPVRVREGLGLGERSSEIFVFIVVIAALVWAGRWYFVVYKNSPTAALMEYMQAVKASDVDAQYKMLSASTKKTYTDKSAYVDKWKIARGLQGRLIDYTIGKIEQKGEQADADVSVAIRKPGQEIYQAAAETVVDHYILVKDPAGWRVALDKCFDQIKSIKYATDFP